MSDFDVRIPMYEMIDGEPLHPLLDYPLENFGSCPNVGDTICLDIPEQKTYSVSRRYHMNLQGWAVIVREAPQSPQTDAVIKAWQEDDEWEAQIEAQEALKEARESELRQERFKLLLGRPPEEIALNSRDEPVMKKLVRRGVGRPYPCRGLRGFGEGTRTALHRRGFIIVHAGSTGKFKDDEISLTPEGAKAWKALVDYREKVEAARTKQ